ncbi:MAG: hypothetical protein JOY71_29065 [Acetobacteraceae bacterium]|nr:hypothetical protein [Acetobacteraceae bacterium]
MAKQTRQQKEIVGRVMHEFKHGELETRGRRVRNPRQAVAIGLSEAGASKRKSPAQNRRSRSRTEAKERQGRTAQQMKEGRKSRTASRGVAAKAGRPPARKATRGRRRGEGPTRAELYQEAQRRGIHGVSRCSKAELERILKRKRG